MMRLLVLAPPGGGKSTQGRRLAADYLVPHISTGDLLRDHVARKTPIGTAAQAYLERGDLVPDELALAVVRQRICEPALLKEFVLDGFPRTLNEAMAAYARATEYEITLMAVVHLIVPEDEIVQRLLERGREGARPDDTEDTIRHRLAQHHTATDPLLDLYRDRRLLVDVNGQGPVAEVTDRIERALAARGLDPPTG